MIITISVIMGMFVVPQAYAADDVVYRALAQRDRKCGFIDETGKEVIPVVYDEILPFVKGVAIVSQNQKVGVVDVFGNVIVPVEYDYIWPFSKNVAAMVWSE